MTNKKKRKYTNINRSLDLKNGAVCVVVALIISSAITSGAVGSVLIQLSQWLYLLEIKVPAILIAGSVYSETLNLLILGLIASVPFIVTKFRLPVQIALISTAISVAATNVLVQLLTHQINSLLLNFLLALLVTVLAYIMMGRVKNTVIAWSLVVFTIGIALYIQPRIVSTIVRQQSHAKSEELFKDTLESLTFEVYYPTYLPTGMKLSEPVIYGYSQNRYSNIYAQYNIDRIEITQGGLLGKQNQIMNFTNHCDIPVVLSNVLQSPTIRDRDIERSIQRPHGCNLIATTVSGKKVYFEERGQWVWFYTQLGSTNIIFKFDRINGQEYDAELQLEILKVIDSMQALDKDRLVRGSR